MKIFIAAAAALISACQTYDLKSLETDADAPVDDAWQEEVNFDFENGDDQWLPDHDHIVIVKKCDQGVPEGYVRFGLVESGTWWKAINIFSGNHWDYELVAVQDAPGVYKYADVPIPNLSVFNYVLSKAKTFGIHTDMYRIANVTEMQAQCTYIFEWLAD